MALFARFVLAWCLFGLAAALPAAGEVAVPALTARVTDLTHTLSEAQRGALERRLAALEAQTGAQVAILLVPGTAPESVEQYSMRVAEAWKLGKKDVDNGLLILVAKDERRARIEVGYGLEGVIPDAIARRVIAETMTPRFAQGDYAGGLLAGVERIASLLGAPGENAAAPVPPARQARNAHGGGDWLGIFFAVLVLAGAFLRAVLGPLIGALVAAALIGAGAWLLSGSFVAALVAAVAAFFFVLLGVVNWLPIGLGGGSGGGGGYSGGGGRFGGGGASGSW
jgi:uncharacterized protein